MSSDGETASSRDGASSEDDSEHPGPPRRPRARAPPPSAQKLASPAQSLLNKARNFPRTRGGISLTNYIDRRLAMSTSLALSLKTTHARHRRSPSPRNTTPASPPRLLSSALSPTPPSAPMARDLQQMPPGGICCPLPPHSFLQHDMHAHPRRQYAHTPCFVFAGSLALVQPHAAAGACVATASGARLWDAVRPQARATTSITYQSLGHMHRTDIRAPPPPPPQDPCGQLLRALAAPAPAHGDGSLLARALCLSRKTQPLALRYILFPPPFCPARPPCCASPFLPSFRPQNTLGSVPNYPRIRPYPLFAGRRTRRPPRIRGPRPRRLQQRRRRRR